MSTTDEVPCKGHAHRNTKAFFTKIVASAIANGEAQKLVFTVRQLCILIHDRLGTQFRAIAMSTTYAVRHMETLCHRVRLNSAYINSVHRNGQTIYRHM